MEDETSYNIRGDLYSEDLHMDLRKMQKGGEGGVAIHQYKEDLYSRDPC